MGRIFFRFLAVIAALTCNQRPLLAVPGGTYPKIEASFELRSVTGNPFDIAENDVNVILASPGHQEIQLPAFFDGGQTWRVRHAPDHPGAYSILRVLLNGKAAEPSHLTPDHFTVGGNPGPGFIRVPTDDKTRFEFDDGQPYYPIGYDLAWQREGEPTIEDSLALMGKARVNWSRIWMCSWDGKALDWFQHPADQPRLGSFSFSAIRKWDRIVDAADANMVYFQMTLQQHGQYSTHADNNWTINPWNKANGGWLNNPSEFFTDLKAIKLTKSKYRYIIARWGYSPSIMAWELFNEVESVDAFKPDLAAVGGWHAEMARFIREQDRYHHLITTSSVTTEPKLWPAMDYYQCHAYPSDLQMAIADLDSEHLPRPFFYGEMGAASFDADPDPGKTIHRLLWGSMVSQSAGTAQYWFWELVEPKHLSQYTAAQKFIDASGMLNHRGLRLVSVPIHTPTLGPFTFGPAIGWAKSKSTHFILNPDGTSEGLTGMSAYLQGRSKVHDMFPLATFDVNCQTAGTFAVHFDQIKSPGARAELSVDHVKVATVTLSDPSSGATAPSSPGSDRAVKIDSTVEIPVPVGSHSIELENTGRDWIKIRSLTISPYAPTLAVLGKANSDYIVLWIYRRNPEQPGAVAGTLSLPRLQPGKYRTVWWNSQTGKEILTDSFETDGNNPTVLRTPPVAEDVAVWIEATQR